MPTDGPVPLSGATSAGPLPDRRAAVAALLRERQELLVVSGLGSSSYDVHAAGDDDRNFYLWGAMGGAALVGMGLAQARPEQRVLVVTGDGEQLMAFGSLATIAVARLKNLSIVVIDNQHFGETGMQSSHTGQGVDLARVAAACGFAETGVCDTLEQVQALAQALHRSATGPRLHVVRVEARNPPRSLPVRDAVFLRNRFRAALGLKPN